MARSPLPHARPRTGGAHVMTEKRPVNLSHPAIRVLLGVIGLLLAVVV